jgi:energy-coupling factor transporter ATP-binding protein EcfA2
MVDRTEEAENRMITQSILRRLKFHELADRRQQISEAHQTTLKWVFDADQMTKKGVSPFSNWLQNEDKIYWITGKAGSGKSTLMKFITGNPRTSRTFAQSHPDSSTMAVAFFFWNSGTNMQMSQEGLLRTLLYGALNKLPALVPQLFPHRWEASRFFGQDHHFHAWSWPELVRGFNLLLETTRSTHEFLFIIDGLDEFEGQSTDLINWIKDVITWPHVKICVSSRPWVVFEDAFKKYPSLTMQTLTTDDIENYVQDRFSNNEGFSILKAAEPQYSEKLITDITQKADGVFLWVVLVVRSLLSGLTSGDRISDLEAKLNALPADLESLFWKMLSASGSGQLERASQLIQLLQVVPQAELLDLAFADDDEQRVLDYPPAPISMKEGNARAEIMRRRIDHFCKGLFEVIPMGGQPLSTARVGYLHRTVKDFLKQDSIRAKFLAVTHSDFSVSAAWCRSFIMQLKTCDPQIQTIHAFWRDVRCCLEFAAAASFEGYKKTANLYDAIDAAAGSLATDRFYRKSMASNSIPNYGEPSKPSLLSTYGSGETPHWTSTRGDTASSRSFLSFAAQCQLLPYLEHVLETSKINLNDMQPPLLYSALLEYPVFLEGGDANKMRCTSPNLKAVYLLLERGADPNTLYEGESVWHHLLHHITTGMHTSLRDISNIEYTPNRYSYKTIDEYTGETDSSYVPSIGSSYVPSGVPSIRSGLQIRSSDIWVDILKACLEHGANPQDAIELLPDTGKYAEAVLLAKSLVQPGQQAKNPTPKLKQSFSKRFRSYRRRWVCS